MFDKEGFDISPGGPPIQANTPIFDVNGERLGTVAQEGVQGDHLVMAKGLIFVHEVDIPLADISHAGLDNVYLKISKEQLGHRPIGTTGTDAPLEPPSGPFYDMSTVNPTGTATQPLPNEQSAAAQRSAVPAESDAPHERVILPPEFVAHPHAAQNYGVSDTPDEPLRGPNSGVAGSGTPTIDDAVPGEGANSGLAGTSAPSVDDAIPLAGPTTPRPDESAVNPYAPPDASSDETGFTRDDDIIRQEQQRME